MSDTTGDGAPQETATTDSGSTMTRLVGTASPRPVDLALLERHRSVGAGWPEAGSGPFLAPGEVVHWHYGRSIDPMRVVRDDERGLVAWLAEGTETLAWTPSDGRPLREIPLAERFLAPRAPAVRRWWGGGVLRIAPTARSWSVWVFREDDGSLAGHYLNLELVHRRDGVSTATRDLLLDLWLEPDGALWLKDADELAAAVGTGQLTAAEAEEVRAVAEWARAEVVEAASWVLDEEWTTWQPPAGWTLPPLPDSADVRAGRSRTLPS